MACPAVPGVAALLLELKPERQQDEVLQALQNQARSNQIANLSPEDLDNKLLKVNNLSTSPAEPPPMTIKWLRSPIGHAAQMQVDQGSQTPPFLAGQMC